MDDGLESYGFDDMLSDPERVARVLAEYCRTIDEQDRHIYRQARHIRDLQDVLTLNGIDGPEGVYNDG